MLLNIPFVNVGINDARTIFEKKVLISFKDLFFT